jgi:hypothetical protein
MNKRRTMVSALLSGALVLGMLAIPASASAGTNPCVSITHISQNVPPGGIGGGYINIGTASYWAGSFIIDTSASGAGLVTQFSTSYETLSNGTINAYVDFVNPYSTYVVYAGWIDIIRSC